MTVCDAPIVFEIVGCKIKIKSAKRMQRVCVRLQILKREMEKLFVRVENEVELRMRR